MSIWNLGLKVYQAYDQSFDVNDISPEKNLQENSTNRYSQEEKKSKIISQDGDIKSPVDEQPAGEQES